MADTQSGSTSGPSPSTTSAADTTSGSTSAEVSTGSSSDDARPHDTTTTLGGVADESTTAVDPTTGGSTGATTGEVPVDYPPCPGGNDDECPEGYACVELTMDGNIVASVCGMSCGAEFCPMASTGTATPFCSAVGMMETCLLFCPGDPCPDGMECTETQLGPICFWPV